MCRPISIGLLALIGSTVLFADGGAPLLLVVNGLSFFYGIIFIVLAEWLVYWKLAELPLKDAFWDALIVNIYSTLVVGILLPLAIGFLGMLGSLIPGHVGQILVTLSTWAYEGSEYPRLLYTSTIIWLIITFFLTVYFEARVLSARWQSRSITPKITAIRLSWISNAITYAGMLIFISGFFCWQQLWPHHR